jgi:hypothetical protein
MAKITAELLEREKEVRGFIETYADLFDLDANLIRGLITQESRFVAEATSPTGCYGYGQFSHIGAKQVQNIATMTDKAADLASFTKQQASDPDAGIKAICATLWWLFNKKYHQITDKKVQLEAVLTFYNAGGRAAALVVQYGGHNKALEVLKALPKNVRSQSVTYAPEVAQWFIAWHEHMAEAKAADRPAPAPTVRPANPFDEKNRGIDVRYRALIEALRLMDEGDTNVDMIINVRDGLTEVTLIFPGELN